MKKFLISAAVAVSATAPAFAADMAVKAPPPPVPVLYNWSGFYIGANGGWGMSDNCWDFVLLSAPVFNDGCHDRSGGLIGGQFGYRWQVNQFVFGLEAQGDWANLSNTQVSLFDPTLTTRAKTDGIGLFTGQIGWAWDTTLLYLKGGAAVTNNHFDIFDTATGLGLVSSGATRWGGTVGVGFEFGFAPNWSFGAEYDHIWMGTSNNSFTTADPRFADVLNNRIRQDVDMITVRINYHFGAWGASPIAARY